MEKINIAELLKDCPKGMKLYSPIFGEVYLDKIRPHLAIVVTTDNEYGNFKEEFLYDGRYRMNGECMLFPSKGETTWEGFQRPFKDGDIIADNHKNIAIYKGKMWYNCNLADFYCGYRDCDNRFLEKPKKDGHFGVIEELHLATEEEKQKLFDVIKENGYKWNIETKTLEKSVEPKFKVGDRIKEKQRGTCGEIISVYKNKYDVRLGDKGLYLYFSNQDNWELVPNKFDITTLKPFDKVLVRTNVHSPWWSIDFYGGYDINVGGSFTPFAVTSGKYFQQCIPYEGNEYLRGTTNDCDDYYKTWK